MTAAIIILAIINVATFIDLGITQGRVTKLEARLDNLIYSIKELTS